MSNPNNFLKWILDTGSSTDDLKAGDLFLNYNANDAVIKHFTNVSISKSQTKDLLNKHLFWKMYARLGKELSIKGTGYALVAFKVMDLPVPRVMELAGNPEYDYLNALSVVDLKTTKIVELDGKSLNVNIRFWTENGNVYKAEGYVDDGVFTPTSEIIDYKMKSIPVVIAENNIMGTPDIPLEVRPLLSTYSYMWDQVKPEWEKVKTIYALNKTYNSQTGAKDLENKIVRDGESFIDINDPDGKLANSISSGSTGTSSLEKLETTLGFIENRIRLFSHQYRDHLGNVSNTATDTNIALFNQQAFEYMIAKHNYLKGQLQMFIQIVAEMLKEDTPNVKMQLTDFEQFRVDIVQAHRDIQTAQAEQARGIANKNNAEATALQERVATPSSTSIDTNLVLKGE